MIPTEIQDTPVALVENGRIHQGFFKTPFRQANLLEANNFGGPLAKPFRWLRLKEWVGFGINHPRLYGAMIIQNAKYVASGTVYLYDKETRRLFEWLIIDLPTRLKLPQTLWRGESRCGRGNRFMLFEHDLEHCRHHVRLEIMETRHAPLLSADLVLHQDWRETDPLVVSLPIPPDHHTYTHKSPLHLEGRITVGGTSFEFDPARDLGNLDEQKTFYPYRSKWRWGCFAAHSAEGREVMVNFVDQMTPEGEPGEDSLWVDGRVVLMEQPDIIHQPHTGSFRVEDKTGRVRLRFIPEGSKNEKRDYWLIAMDYQQYFGHYCGEVVDDEGCVHRIDDAFGALESMDARF